MSDPTLKIRASEALLRELMAAHKTLKRSKTPGVGECPNLEALLVSIHQVRARALGALTSPVGSGG